MTRLLIVLSVCLCFLLPGLIEGMSALPGERADGPHPDAPAETAQYAFLIGEWHCTSKQMQPDGSYRDGPGGTWTGAYILDGYAIQDVFVSTGPSGKPSYGTNIRSFNPETKQWDNRWLAAGNLQWSYFSSEQVGDTMVMTGGEGTDGRGAFVDRNVFHSITPDRWEWRKDRSWDGGETWIEGVGLISARRKGTSP